MANIYAFIGVIGSGKNFRAENLLNNLPSSAMVNFSDGVRENSWKLLNWRPSSVEEYEKFKRTEFINEQLGVSFTGRMILQRIGTDIMRGYDHNVWAKIWGRETDFKIRSGVDNIIVSDLRYLNEVEEIKKLAFLGHKVEIVFTDFKSKRYEISGHESEALAIELLNSGFIDGDDVTKFLFNKV